MQNIATKGFDGFGLREELVEALEARDFDTPTPVQEAVLGGEALNGDMIVQARTGSGKTLAFLLPLLNEMTPGKQDPQVLVLSPTRELARQSAVEARLMGKSMGITAATLVGGMPMDKQIQELRSGSAVVVGTPGRVLDHLKRKTFRSGEVQTVVLDEGDTMLDMGFREELEAILDALPGRRRGWLFSATMPQAMRRLADRYLEKPAFIALCDDAEQHDDIAHRVMLVPSGRHKQGLVNLVLNEAPPMTLVFTHTKAETVEVKEFLREEGIRAGALHGDMSQMDRNRVLADFRKGRIAVLVATNVAARGLDVEGVTHVVQLGMPESLETFMHRSGRTGRAGQSGSNLLLLSPREKGRFKGMLRGAKLNISWERVPDQLSLRDMQRRYTEEQLEGAPVPGDSAYSWAETLLATWEPRELVARLLAGTAVRPGGYPLAERLQRELEQRDRKGKDRRRASDAPRPRNKERRPMSGRTRTVRISKGRNEEDWSVGRILAVLCDRLDVDRSEIGNIKMRDTHTEVELGPGAVTRLEQGGEQALSRSGLLHQGASRGEGPRNKGGQKPKRS